MDITVFPGQLQGKVDAIASKSQAHRLLICAAFADMPTTILCKQTNQDIEATVACLNALGAEISRTETGYHVVPVRTLQKVATLPCNESGSTLRFMLPIVGALGVHATFIMKGRLPQRPLSPLWEEMERMGCQISRPDTDTLACSGQLRSGKYHIKGNVSSQYITGLLFALTLIRDDCALQIEGTLESKPYVDMTLQALRIFGVNVAQFTVSASQCFLSPGTVLVEGDWSNSAFFLCANQIGSNIVIDGLNPESSQGDREIESILKNINTNPMIDAANIPDLVPVLAVTAAASNGATFTNIHRLRLKESDRVASVSEMLLKLGANADVTENTMVVHPAQFHECTINTYGDHRIAMSAAIAATVATGPVTILGADCVAKSYPSFWREYQILGGQYEQHIR